MKTNRLFINKILIAAAVIVLIAVVGIIATLLLNSGSRELKKHLDLGQKYLDEGDYEKALAAFEKALETDPKSTEAYIGAADASEGKASETENADDQISIYQKMIEELLKGYELTGDERLKEKAEELQRILDELLLSKANENKSVILAGLQKLNDEYSALGNFSPEAARYKSWDEKSVVVDPIINGYEDLANQAGTWISANGNDDELVRNMRTAYLNLSRLCLLTCKLDKAEQHFASYYDICQDGYLDIVKEGDGYRQSFGGGSYYIFNKYGNVTENVNQMENAVSYTAVFSDNQQLIEFIDHTMEWDYSTYEYAADGRVISESHAGRYGLDDEDVIFKYRQDLSYPGGNNVSINTTVTEGDAEMIHFPAEFIVSDIGMIVDTVMEE